MFPSADEVALAIVAAARVHGDDPVAVARGAAGVNRGRALAYAVLCEAFPKTVKARIAIWCGFRAQSVASAHLIHARKTKWWSEDALDEIVGQLVADDVEPVDVPHFERDERKLISNMWQGGADATAIAATLGVSPAEMSAWAAANPASCPPRGGEA